MNENNLFIAKSGRRPLFIQPLAVALVCAVFIALSLVSGVMNMKMLERTIRHFLEYKAAIPAAELMKNAEWHYRSLRNSGTALHSVIFPRSAAGGVSLQESFLMDLMALGNRLASLEEPLSPSRLQAIAVEENLQNVILIDAHGKISESVAPVPQKLSQVIMLMISGKAESTIRIFNRHGLDQEYGFMAVRRLSGRGLIVMVLDDLAFRRRCAAFSLQQAMAQMRLDQETVYLAAFNEQNQLLAMAGEAPEIHHSAQRQPVSLTANQLSADSEGRIMEISQPFAFDDLRMGDLRIGVSVAAYHHIIHENRRLMMISIISLAVISALSLWLLYRNQNNHLAEIGQLERNMFQAERLTALGGLAAGVAHEIRNPLNAISIGIQRLQRETGNPLTGVIRDEIKRLNRIVEDFISIARTDNLVFKALDLRIPLEQLALLMEEEAVTHGVSLQSAWEDLPFMVRADGDKIKQAVLNLIRNAIDASPPGGQVLISLTPENEQWIKVSIKDQGSGLTQDEIDRIFDPDYTTKEKGLGLGLTLAYQIIQGHGGEISVFSQPGSGTVFDLRLPRFNPAMDPSSLS